MSDNLLLQLKQAALDRQAGKPGAEERFKRLLEKLRQRGPYGLRKPAPATRLADDES